MKKIDQLPEDIYKLLQGKLAHDPQILEKFGPALGDILTKRLKDLQVGDSNQNAQYWLQPNIILAEAGILFEF